MKKTLGEVGRKPSLADVDLNKIKPSDVVLTLDEFLVDVKRLMTMFFNNEFEPAVEGIQLYSNTSVLHSLGLSILHFLQMMLTMSKKQMDVAVAQVAKTNSKVDAQRYQRSYKNLLVKPNYNNFTDLQCQAEITFVLGNLIHGALIGLRDQSVLGVINAGYKINVAYRNLNECNNIQKYKTNWTSEQVRRDFEAVVFVAEGGFEIVLSMFPAKLAKLLEYIGFNCNQQHALQLIEKSCEDSDLLTFHISSYILAAYYGVFEFVYGLGEKRMDIMDRYATICMNKCPKGAFTMLIVGFTNMNRAKFDEAVICFQRVIDEQDYWPQLHFVAHILLCLCHSIRQDWDKALVSSARLRDKCKWSSSLFYYIHSVFLQLKLKEQTPEQQIETRKLIKEQLELVPKLKRKLGGIHVFHEELGITRSKKFKNNIDEMVLIGLEIFYFWNLYAWMEENQKYLQNTLDLIEIKFDELKKDENGNVINKDIYYFLIFHRAVIFRYFNRLDEAEIIFRDIINNDKQLKFNNYLVPISWFELSRIKYDQGNLKESKKCLKKVSSFSNYFGEGLTVHRVGLMNDKIKNQSKLQNSEIKS